MNGDLGKASSGLLTLVLFSSQEILGCPDETLFRDLQNNKTVIVDKLATWGGAGKSPVR